MFKRTFLLALALLLAGPIAASADYTIRQGDGTVSTVFAYICSVTKICTASVPTNSSGQELATATNPMRIDPTGTTVQPVNGSGFTQPTTSVSRANIATNQVSVATTATLIAAARSGRDSITVENHGTTDVFIGGSSGVTTSTGLLLPGTKGASITIPYSGAVYAIVGTGTQAVSYLENY